MNNTRRDLLRIGVGALAAPAFGAPDYSLRAGRARARLGTDGRLLDLRYEDVPLVAAALGDWLPELTIGGDKVRLGPPVQARRTSAGAVFEYSSGGSLPLDISYTVELRSMPDGSCLFVQRIAWKSRGRYSAAIQLNLPRNVRLPGAGRSSLAPARDGVARRSPIPDRGSGAFLYRMGGGEPDADAQRLAIPLLSESSTSGELRLTVTSDAGYSTVFQLAGADSPGRFGWVHTTGSGAGEAVQRTFYTLIHKGSDRRALSAIYDGPLAAVPPGPEWLHHVNLVGYDYLSKAGQGWFADVDALSKLLEPAERARAVVTIHGWYDYVGRYAFNPKTGVLDRRWTAFYNVRHPQFVAHATGPRSKTATHWGWRKIFDRLRPVEMSLDDLHRRMRYARERGFRCLLYFADGLNSGDEVAGVHEPEKVLAHGGWIGPETAGKTYVQNPLHPGVRAFYRDYLQALLAEFGKDIDGFVWDETFHVKAGNTGTERHPGYADAAMMSLVGELREATERYDKRLAFLASDNVGTNYETPYALMAHGTYQDSMCGQGYWPYGLFPNLRNSLWSCNWYHQTTWKRNEDAVAWYQIPVAVSNGYGDDTGPSDMNTGQAERMMALFRRLGQRRLELGWIEETSGRKTYKSEQIG